MVPQAGADGSTTMIIGFGLLFIAYALASFAIIQGLIFPHLAQGAPVAAILLLAVGSYGGRVDTSDHDPAGPVQKRGPYLKTLPDRARSAPPVDTTHPGS